jgi:hypothetical protein
MVLTEALALVEKAGILLANGFLALKRIEIGFSSMAVKVGSSLAGSFESNRRKVLRFYLMKESITDC